MAKDAPNKSVSNSNNTSSDNNLPPISDQQKVPPLRIVLNTSGNQKSSSTAIAVAANQQQPQDIKREKSQNASKTSDGALKTGGRVRIKLGTNKQQVSKSNNSSESSNKSSSTDDAQRVKGSLNSDSKNIPKEESSQSTTNLSHLRRITRRSQRTVQTVSNEDEESISSMTSTDENQNTTTNNSNNSDNNSVQDAAASVAQSTVAPNTANITNNSSSNSETPRRYKRRKGEPVECQSSEQDGAFGFQSYKLPVQNSFELYKNIRKQVDKRLKNLSCIHPKTPHGFRDYMLNRGAYLLDGNKLGNGTNLFMNEDGGLHPAPIGKYRALRQNRVNYSVPNRAKVPLGLPVNSPLYNLFIEQEKERYRMRMQHIKEREKLTLAAEQEIIRVYNQAAMAAANQLEPFSACTMLKHQEIYNYLDSDGFTILANEDAQQEDQANKQEESRTRGRHHHEQISPPTTRKGSNAEESPPSSDSSQNQKNSKTTSQVAPAATTTAVVEESQKDETDKQKTAATTTTNDELCRENLIKIEKQGSVDVDTSTRAKSQEADGVSEDKTAKSVLDAVEEAVGEKIEIKIEGSKDNSTLLPKDRTAEMNVEGEAQVKQESNKETESLSANEKPANGGEADQKQSNPSLLEATSCHESNESENQDRGSEQVVPMELDPDSHVEQATSAEHVLSDDDRQAYNKEVFLSQLQDIDDKWDKIRGEMLIRHRNEAESLHAVQRLEWEWKTKEIGACDIRTTPTIDDILVPKLNIYSQDY